MKLHHICIQTDSYEESLKFYNDILGFTLIKETAPFHKRFYNSWLQQDSFMIELQTNKLDEALVDFNKSNKGIVHFALFVDDIETEYIRLKNLGFDRFKSKHGQDIYQVEGGKLFKIIAPEGTIIEIRNQAHL